MTWRRKGSSGERRRRKAGGSPEERKGGWREAALAGTETRHGRSASSSSDRTDGAGSGI